MTLKAYEPKVSVLLIKAQKRTEIQKGMTVAADRYTSAKTIDLTPYLGDSGGVRVVKGLREPAGAFSVILADKKHPDFMESLYALIEPMDLIEIRMAHDPSEYAKPGKGYKIPVVMRGFVSSIGRTEVMGADGRPSRAVRISGQDYGKILEILRIIYIKNSVVGANVLTANALFEKFSIEAKIMTANDFVQKLLDKVIHPYMFDLLGDVPAGLVPDIFTPKLSVQGVTYPIGVQNFEGGSVQQLIASFCDVGPFNELYVEDTNDAVLLVLRPNPFERVDGSVIQDGAKCEEYSIPDDWLIADMPSRSDAGVANYFWVGNTSFSLVYNDTMKMMAQTGNESDYIAFDHPNCASTFYGVRKMEVESRLGDPKILYGDNEAAATLAKQKIVQANWLDRRRNILAESNKDNVVFESGSMRLYGSEKIKAGRYLTVRRGGFLPRCYITRVEHDFTPFRGFFTTVTYERGDGFIKRSQLPKSGVAYSQESNGAGVFGVPGKFSGGVNA